MSEADLTQRYEDLRQVACRLTDVLLNLDEQSNAESLRNIVRLQIPSVTECVTPYTEALEEEIPGAYRVRLSITRTELVKALEDHYPALCTALAEMQTAVSTMQTTIDGTRAIIGGKQAGMEHHENREAARKRRNQATQDVEDKIKELRGKTAALHGDMLDADHRWDTDDELQ
jgi:hypothetical protein